MNDQAQTLNDLLRDAAPLGSEQLYAVAIVNGRAVRFAVVKANAEGGELVLVLERRTWEGPHR